MKANRRHPPTAPALRTWPQWPPSRARPGLVGHVPIVLSNGRRCPDGRLDYTSRNQRIEPIPDLAHAKAGLPTTSSRTDVSPFDPSKLSTQPSSFFAICQSQSPQSLTFLTEIKSDWGDINKTAVASEKSSQLSTHRRKAACNDGVVGLERVGHRYENFLIGSRRQSSRNSTPTVPAVSSMV